MSWGVCMHHIHTRGVPTHVRTSSRLRQTCVGQSPILSRYVNVTEGWKRVRERRGGEQWEWWTREMGDAATLELSSVWQCSITTTLAGLSAHYVDRRSHPRTTANFKPVPSLIRDQEMPYFLGFRGDINVEWNKLRDSEFMCRNLLNVEINNKRKMKSLTQTI